MSVNFSDFKNYRALDLGTGAGDIAIALASKGWDVTAIDNAPRSREIIEERTKYIKAPIHFQETAFEEAKFSETYDLVTSFFALPFGDKGKLPKLMSQLSQHMNRGAVFTANFFGQEHSFVKQGVAYGVTDYELKELLSANGFEIEYFLHRHYTQKNLNGSLIHWDLFDITAVKI